MEPAIPKTPSGQNNGATNVKPKSTGSSVHGGVRQGPIKLWLQRDIEVLNPGLGLNDQRVGDGHMSRAAISGLQGQPEARDVRARYEPHPQLGTVLLVSVIDSKPFAEFGCRGPNNVVLVSIVDRKSVV